MCHADSDDYTQRDAPARGRASHRATPRLLDKLGTLSGTPRAGPLLMHSTRYDAGMTDHPVMPRCDHPCSAERAIVDPIEELAAADGRAAADV
jgi:hypothetical protein